MTFEHTSSFAMIRKNFNKFEKVLRELIGEKKMKIMK